MNYQETKDLFVIFCTISPESSKKVADALVQEKLVACVNISPNLTSIYYWDNQVCSEKEDLLIMKTSKNKVDACFERIKALHPYEVPEMIAYPIQYANPAYYAWVMEQTASSIKPTQP